jgi:hypothetical protein
MGDDEDVDELDFAIDCVDIDIQPSKRPRVDHGAEIQSTSTAPMSVSVSATFIEFPTTYNSSTKYAENVSGRSTNPSCVP